VYENLNSEELDYILNAGLEKVAYEEGLNDYAESLEKVATVHNVDAVELHEFLEKEAEEEKKDSRGVGAAIGGGILGMPGAAIGGAIGSKDGERGRAAGYGALGSFAGGLPGALIGNAPLTMAGRAAGAYYGAEGSREKTASAYGLDGDTFDALFNAGVEALTK
jgi:hypothetical protein